MKILLIPILFYLHCLWPDLSVYARNTIPVKYIEKSHNILGHSILYDQKGIFESEIPVDSGLILNSLYIPSHREYLPSHRKSMDHTNFSYTLAESPAYAVNFTDEDDGTLPVFSAPPSFLAIKTNALLWVATIMNLEGEIFINQHLSASLGFSWCPWFLSDRFAARNISLLPEGRWWFGNDRKGHFAGVHLSLAWFNVKLGDYRYQDVKRPLIGAGITYGYYFDLAPRWGVELSFGAGYASLRYDRYHNVENGAKIDTRLTSWLGIDRLSITFSYRIKSGA